MCQNTIYISTDESKHTISLLQTQFNNIAHKFKILDSILRNKYHNNLLILYIECKSNSNIDLMNDFYLV